MELQEWYRLEWMARRALDAGIKTAFFLYTLPPCFPACFPLPASILNFYVKPKRRRLKPLFPQILYIFYSP